MECHCECWRCKRGGHCVRCDCVGNTGHHPLPLVPVPLPHRDAADRFGRLFVAVPLTESEKVECGPPRHWLRDMMRDV